MLAPWAFGNLGRPARKCLKPQTRPEDCKVILNPVHSCTKAFKLLSSGQTIKKSVFRHDTKDQIKDFQFWAWRNILKVFRQELPCQLSPSSRQKLCKTLWVKESLFDAQKNTEGWSKRIKCRRTLSAAANLCCFCQEEDNYPGPIYHFFHGRVPERSISLDPARSDLTTSTQCLRCSADAELWEVKPDDILDARVFRLEQ